VEAVTVKVAEDSIVLEADTEGTAAASTGGIRPVVQVPLDGQAENSDGPPRERGRVKWFDAEKGYGFLVRPTGEDLFVHHSEVQGDPSSLSPNDEVEYEVGQNDRGPNARRVQPTN
jgi:cold shock CspA family protein